MCTWEERRQQLADFKDKFRHTNVPIDYAEDKPLGCWVMNQKAQYKLFTASKTSSMTREQIQSLDEFDFEWEVQASSCTWEERHQQLVDFKDKFLHTNVPQKYAENNRLGRWVNKQRINYKKNLMTKYRIQSLNKLGFEWYFNTSFCSYCSKF